MILKQEKDLRDFPINGKTRAKENANYLGIGLSTFWKYVKKGKIKRPLKYGQRVSVWDAEYIRKIANEGFE